jgi:hypothetical protein
VEPIARDENSFFRRLRPFVALETIRNNEWLRINKSEDCDMYMGTIVAYRGDVKIVPTIYIYNVSVSVHFVQSHDYYGWSSWDLNKCMSVV